MRWLLLLALSTPAFGQVDTPPPAALKDGRIEVHLKDGKQYDYSENEWKVVPRSSSRKVQALIDSLRKQLAECQAKLKAAEAADTPPTGQVAHHRKAPESRDRLTFLAGVGPDGVVAKEVNDGQTVSSRTSPLIGIGYAHKFGEHWSLGGELLRGIAPESKTYTGMAALGYDL
jgi:hypothetical protein